MSTLTTTINDRKFNTTFKEVPTSGALGVHGNEDLRLFRLRDVIDNCFDKDALKTFIAKNIGQYVFSRSKIKNYYDEGEELIVGIEALDLMHQKGQADARGTGNEIGEIMLYIFLECVLKAPKVYSKIELNSTVRNKTSVADSIHLRLFDAEGDNTSYEMVFGASSIVGDLGDAIDEAFGHIASIKQQAREEIRIVDETVFDLPEDDPVAVQMNELLKVEPGKETIRDSAYGIFLGYTLGLDKNRTSSEYRNLIDSKMDDEILAYLPQMQRKIEELGLRNNSFYIYVFPFDDAEDDKKNIMKKVMREGA
jgi:hypothetical protein